MSRLVPHGVHTTASERPEAGIRLDNPDDAFVADLVSPPVRVDFMADKFPTFPIGVWLRDEAKPVAAGDRPPAVNFDIDLSLSYRCSKIAVVAPLPREVTDNSDMDLAAGHLDLVRQKVMIRRERLVASLFTTVSTWDNEIALAAGVRWNTATSDVKGDLWTAIDTVKDAVGRCNTAIIPELAWRHARDDSALTALVAGSGLTTQEAFSRYFDVDVVVASARYTESIEGNATQTPAYIWPKSVWVGYVNREPVEPSMPRPSASYSPRFQSESITTRRFHDKMTYTDFVGAQSIEDELVTCSAAGFLYSTVID